MRSTTLIKKGQQELLRQPHELQNEVLNNLYLEWIWWERIAKKLNSLMDAVTINNNWDVMPDNKAQLEALKLILKLNGAKIDSGMNINFFNIPNPNDPLKY